MIEFINEYHPSYVVDATHPYAIEVTENLQNACEKAGVPYLRILRDTGAEKSDCIYVDSMDCLLYTSTGRSHRGYDKVRKRR